jgi:hypothetical protein
MLSIRLPFAARDASAAGRVKVPSGVKPTPHRHQEDQIYTVMSGVFYIGLGDQFDVDTVQAYPLRTVTLLPGNPSHSHRARAGEYVAQVTAIGQLIRFTQGKPGGVGLQRCTQLHRILFAECIGCFIPFRRERGNAEQGLDLRIGCRRARDYRSPVGATDEDEGPLPRFHYTHSRRNVAF